jgi:hypothetical protein
MLPLVGCLLAASLQAGPARSHGGSPSFPPNVPVGQLPAASLTAGQVAALEKLVGGIDGTGVDVASPAPVASYPAVRRMLIPPDRSVFYVVSKGDGDVCLVWENGGTCGDVERIGDVALILVNKVTGTVSAIGITTSQVRAVTVHADEHSATAPVAKGVFVLPETRGLRVDHPGARFRVSVAVS